MRALTIFPVLAALCWPGLAFAQQQQQGAPSTDPALSAQANAAYLAANAKKPGVIVKPDGLQIKIVQSGFGKRPAATLLLLEPHQRHQLP